MSKTKTLPQPPTTPALPMIAAVSETHPRLFDGDQCLRKAANLYVEACEHFTAAWGEEYAELFLPKAFAARLIVARARLRERQEREAARKGGAE